MFNKKTKKEEQKKKSEIEKKAQKFIEEYKELAKKHECEIQAYLTFSERGVIPGLRVVEKKEEQKNDK